MYIRGNDKLLSKEDKKVLEDCPFLVKVSKSEEEGNKGYTCIDLFTASGLTHAGQMVISDKVALHNYLIDRTGIYVSVEKAVSIVAKFYNEAIRKGNKI